MYSFKYKKIKDYSSFISTNTMIRNTTSYKIISKQFNKFIRYRFKKQY